MLYFILGSITYLLAASLPLFLANGKLNESFYYILGALLAAGGACLWLTLAKGLNPSQLSIWGLKWDVMITICYLVVPFFFIKQSLNSYNIIGMVLALIGVILLKL